MSYDLHPEIKVDGDFSIYNGNETIWKKLQKEIEIRKGKVIAIECYPGTNEEKLLNNLIEKLKPDLTINANDIFISSNELDENIQEVITADRVFGVMSHHSFEDFINKSKLEKKRKKIHDNQGDLIVIYGTGASYLTNSDILVYMNLTRWEIQQRYINNEITNWNSENDQEEFLRKLKRGYFFDWRIADKLKKKLFNKIDYMIDANNSDSPKMISGKNYNRSLLQVAQKPFRLVPYFDSGVWGGKWLQEKFNVHKEKSNLAWGFDGVPEENSIYLTCDDVRFEAPAIDLVYQQPVLLMGEKVYGRYGESFPIRFDLLDTMAGGDLSLQVHPKVSYAQEEFGIHYTQDESYYIMEAKENAVIYLGVQKGVRKDYLVDALKSAHENNGSFHDEEFIYKRNIQKHDHYSIPAGTIHCSGKDCVVLEISSTPNRFTFKLWDWERLGLDGVPRPIHIKHGSENIEIERDQDWVENNLVNQFEKIHQESGWMEEKTGLHMLEPIETRRHWFNDRVHHSTHDSVNMLNLVEGEEAIVKSLDQSFEPFVVHYGETFIIPECIKEYIIEPSGNSIGKTLATVKAYIK